MPTLLLLLHRRGSRPVLPARTDLWCPFRLQFYCNGHSWLVTRLIAHGIDYAMADNAFIHIDDFAPRTISVRSVKTRRAASHSRSLRRNVLSGAAVFGQRCYWSLMQTEYSTDLAFHSDAILSVNEHKATMLDRGFIADDAR